MPSWCFRSKDNKMEVVSFRAFELQTIMKLTVVFLFAVTAIGVGASYPCVVKKYSPHASVCVCNSTYCDTFNVTAPGHGKMLITTTSRIGQRFDQDVIDMAHLVAKDAGKESVNIIKINQNLTFQTIKGFGGALTDAAALNFMNLSAKARANLIKSYFGREGIEYNLIRLPMGACDYSPRKYTYLDTPDDFSLSTFALAPEDTKLKIPLLKQILSSSVKDLSLYASPWTAPAWMKTNDKETGLGRLRGVAGDKYHKTWAEYFTNYLDAFGKEGINFWGVTMQNEPSNGLLTPGQWQTMGWTAKEQKDFVKVDLGPMLRAKNYSHIKLMILDDQRLFLPLWPDDILSDPEVAQYVSGIGVHWYWDWLIGPEVLNDTHNMFPDKFILATEACNSNADEHGNWEMGEKYSNDIIDNLNNWGVGWVDWNMCLNIEGGPSWMNHTDSSPIRVNGSVDEFYKQPMYYHLGHFSKFIPEGSVRIYSFSNAELKVKHVAIQRKDGHIVVVVLNKEDSDVAVKITTANISLDVTVPKRSIQTYMWQSM